MSLYKLLMGTLTILLLLGFTGCSDSGSVGNKDTSSAQPSTGTLSLLLTDAPGDYQAVYVTIEEVLVHKAEEDELFINNDENETDDTTKSDDVNLTEDIVETEDDSGWIVVAQPNKTYDLLTLQNNITEELGETDVTTGKYTQMRLVLGSEDDNGSTIAEGYETHPFANYLVLTGGDVAELDVPSNTLKLNHNFEITEDGLVTMIIDFDANKSVNEAGNSGKWILTPVISVKTKTKTQETEEEDGEQPENESEEESN